LLAVQCFTMNNGTAINDGGDRPSFKKYQVMREKLLTEHLDTALGSDIVLSAREQQFNDILMELKGDELARGFQNPFNFTPSRHFFEVLKSVETSPLFELIRKMPKGEQATSFSASSKGGKKCG
jgi:Adenosine/AMP deaminase N-terminal